MANVAQLCNNLYCLFLAGGENGIVTPTYHVFDMYKNHQGAECLRTLVSDNGELKSRVSASASVKDGVMTVTLANLSCTEDAEISLNLLGFDGKIAAASATVLASDDMRNHNTFENPEAVTPVTFDVDVTKTVTLPKAGVVALTLQLA